MTRWAKTRHIPHFLKIEIRLEIGILMLNCVVVKKWQWSVAWFPSYGAKRIANVERKFSRKRNVFTLLQKTVMTPYHYAIMLRKIDLCFCIHSMIVLLCELSSKNGVKNLLRQHSTHRFYSFRTCETLNVYNRCIICQTLLILWYVSGLQSLFLAVLVPCR